MASAEGGERYSNRRTLSIPRVLRERITGARSVRWISGIEVAEREA
jgi:hypothetical protein